LVPGVALETTVAPWRQRPDRGRPPATSQAAARLSSTAVLLSSFPGRPSSVYRNHSRVHRSGRRAPDTKDRRRLGARRRSRLVRWV